jgi:hypothetical protein
MAAISLSDMPSDCAVRMILAAPSQMLGGEDLIGARAALGARLGPQQAEAHIEAHRVRASVRRAGQNQISAPFILDHGPWSTLIEWPSQGKGNGDDLHGMSGIFPIGGDLPVRRMGFGAMQLTGPGVWGPPKDLANAQAVLRRAIELGVDFIDTADVYGPGDNERLIRAALHPYPPGLVIGTKAGLVRSGPATRENPGLSMNGTEAHIRRAVEGSLRDLGVELHRPLPAAPRRSGDSDRGNDARLPRAAGGRKDPAHRPVGGRRRGDRTGTRGRRDRDGAERLQPCLPPA